MPITHSFISQKTDSTNPDGKVQPSHWNANHVVDLGWKDVRDYGAAGDGVTDDTAAIQAALTAAGAAGGGVVYLPSGTYRLTAALLVPSNTVLRLDPTAVLVRDYVGGGAVNATIRNANQTTSDSNIWIIGGEFQAADATKTGKHLGFQNVTGLHVIDCHMTSCYSDWNTIFANCTNVLIRGVYIDTATTLNADGLHFCGGGNIVVDNCVLLCGDDCVSFTSEVFSGVDTPDLRGASVTNCFLRSSEANLIRVSKTAAATGTIRDVVIAHCTGDKAGAAAGTVVRLLDEGNDGSVSHLTLAHCHFDCTEGYGEAVNVEHVHHVLLDDIRIDSPSARSFFIAGGSHITLRDCYGLTPRGANVQNVLAAGVTDLRIEGGYFEGARSQPIMGLGGSFNSSAGIAVSGLTTARLRNVTLQSTANNTTGITLTTGTDVEVSDCYYDGSLGTSTGITITNGTRIRLDRVTVSASNAEPFYVVDGTDVLLSSCTALSPRAASMRGIRVDAGTDVRIMHPLVVGATHHGIEMGTVVGGGIFGGRVQDSTLVGIRLGTASAFVVTGTRCVGNGSQGFLSAATCSGNRYIYNDWTANTGASANTSDVCTLVGNAGWVTEGGGTASVADGGTIAHGLNVTPGVVHLTATAAGHIATVTSVDGTNITIGLKLHDGSAIAVAENVRWHASRT